MSIHGFFQTVPLEGTALALLGAALQWGCPALVLPLEWELWAGQGAGLVCGPREVFSGAGHADSAGHPGDFMAWSSGFSH